MSVQQVQGLALDPRTKILIWLLANVVVFAWTPEVFRMGVMLAYFVLFLLERKGKMLAGLLLAYLAVLAIQYWLLPVLPGSLATVFATVTYFILVFPCIAGGAYIIATTSVSQFMAALERMVISRNFSITLAVTLRFLPALRQDFRHIRDAMALRRIRGLEQKLECVYVPMLMGAAQTAEELSESATSQGHRTPGETVFLAAYRVPYPGRGGLPGLCGPMRGRHLLQGGSAMIAFDHVTYTYEGREQPSLRDCSFTVEPGELVLLTGESGCGKTTIIKLINGLLQHGGGGTLEGMVTVNGQEVSQVPLWELSQTVGSVFQNPKSQFFNLDTTSEVLFGLESRGASIRRWSRPFPLPQGSAAWGRSWNGISLPCPAERSSASPVPVPMPWDRRSLCWTSHPPTWTARGIRQLREILKQLKAAGKTILVAEHRLWYAADMADRVFYLREGRMEQVYSGAEFLSLPEERRRAMGLRSLTEVPLPEPQLAPGETRDGLSVRSLRASYDRTAVWEQVSFSAPRGQITAITGHNGAGKTTLARCLCGLMKEKTGTILWDGKPASRKDRKRLGFLIMQDVNLQLFADSVLAEAQLGNDANEMEAMAALERMDLALYAQAHPLGALRWAETAAGNCRRLPQRKRNADF